MARTCPAGRLISSMASREAVAQHVQRLGVGMLDQVRQVADIGHRALVAFLHQLGLPRRLGLRAFGGGQLAHVLGQLRHRLLHDFHVAAGHGLRALQRQAIGVGQHLHVAAVRGQQGGTVRDHRRKAHFGEAAGHLGQQCGWVHRQLGRVVVSLSVHAELRLARAGDGSKQACCIGRQDASYATATPVSGAADGCGAWQLPPPASGSGNGLGPGSGAAGQRQPAPPSARRATGRGPARPWCRTGRGSHRSARRAVRRAIPPPCPAAAAPRAAGGRHAGGVQHPRHAAARWHPPGQARWPGSAGSPAQQCQHAGAVVLQGIEPAHHHIEQPLPRRAALERIRQRLRVGQAAKPQQDGARIR